MKEIILASTSPRRKELLSHLKIPFTVVASEYEEDMTKEMDPLELAKELSRGKAEDVAKKYPNHIIIGGDTFVVLHGTPIGKPFKPDRAKEMLRRISGQCLDIVSAVTVIDGDKVTSEGMISKVYVRNITEDEIEKYVATGEPLDRAGAFSIEGIGAIFIERIEGDYAGIIGLPVCIVAKILKESGVPVL